MKQNNNKIKYTKPSIMVFELEQNDIISTSECIKVEYPPPPHPSFLNIV